MSPSGYRQIEHTADLALELWAPTEEELLRVAARAVVDLLTDDLLTDDLLTDDLLTGAPEAASPSPTTPASRHIELDAVDAEDRLVQWLNEVIVAAVTDGFLITDADIVLRENRLSAEVRGQESAGDQIVTELKSATYHDLELRSPDHDDQGWRARVVIDV